MTATKFIQDHKDKLLTKRTATYGELTYGELWGMIQDLAIFIDVQQAELDKLKKIRAKE